MRRGSKKKRERVRRNVGREKREWGRGGGELLFSGPLP